MYCGRPRLCRCLGDIILCQQSNLQQIPYFTKNHMKSAVRLNMRANSITHPRGDLSKTDWINLQTIDLRNNPIKCESNLTSLKQRFSSVLTDNCTGNFIHTS